MHHSGKEGCERAPETTVRLHGQANIVGWDDAKIHVSTKASIRGISVFEGIKGYWSRDGGNPRSSRFGSILTG
jgi:hypothetical protein